MPFGQLRRTPPVWLQQRLCEKPWSLCRAKESLCHCAKETACALGWRNLGEILGSFAIDGRLLELGKR